MPMKNKPIHNPGGSTMFVEGVMIPPGETRHVTVFEPDEVPTIETVIDPDVVLAQELYNGTAKEVIEALEAQSLTVLELLDDLEEASAQPRKTVREAIAKEKLDRAAAAGDETGEEGTEDETATEDDTEETPE